MSKAFGGTRAPPGGSLPDRRTTTHDQAGGATPDSPQKGPPHDRTRSRSADASDGGRPGRRTGAEPASGPGGAVVPAGPQGGPGRRPSATDGQAE